ncbi:amino acid synthesis family protein [Kribbella sp. NPDC048915]|uniref:amino acid synthesis family protein n=1 Tax=Kribbella sp. NPDC048915 TaxID=3155148 RepID=UPI0033FA2F34
MDANALIRKLVHFEEEIRTEYGQPVQPVLRRVVQGAVIANPCLSPDTPAGLPDLVDVSAQLGIELTRRALERVGDATGIRAYAKAVVVGTAGDKEHGAAMIHARLGMAMRQTIRRGRVLIPGNAKVGPAGTPIDVCFGPIDEGWDLDAMDSLTVSVADAPHPDEILLLVAYAYGPRANARTQGPSQADVDQLLVTASA